MTPDAAPASPAAAEPQQGVTRAELGQIVERHRGRRGMLIAVLDAIQKACGYLPESALRGVAEQTGRSLVDVYGVATFYKSFSLTPRGKHLISACLGTACHVRGAPRVVEEFERQLGVEAGQTTPDKEFTFQTLNCLGACALGPIVVADGRYFSNVTTARVADIIQETREGLDKLPAEAEGSAFPIEASCSCCNHSLMDPTRLVDGLPSIRVTVGFEARHFTLGLSSLYGSAKSVAEAQIPAEAVVPFYCPHCREGLVGASTCVDCGAPLAPMILKGGGVLQVCTRRACGRRRLDLSGVNG